jgi:hypothetical protein
MRTLNILAFLSAAFFFEVATAAPDLLPSSDTATPRGHILNPTNAADVCGTYKLSNGRSLRVSFESNRLYAAIGNGKKELLPIADNVYVTRDGSMKLTFQPHALSTDVVLDSDPNNFTITSSVLVSQK